MTTRALILRLALCATALQPLAAIADPAPASPMEEAGKHFERGVSLYDEADYRAALVEFRRAYEIAPNAVVLYNIGETYYQLQNYALALTTLERYLTESRENAEHRPEVEKTIEILRSRVGKVEITTNVPGCEITIDDEYVGKTPLAQAVPVSIGRRKITAMRAGLPPDTRFVEVAAGDVMKTTLVLAEPAERPALVPTQVPKPEEAPRSTSLVTASWVTTGVLGAGAITMGGLAYKASRDLKDARNTFGATHADLESKASRVTTFAAVADIVGVVALVAAGVSLKLTLSRSRSHEVHALLAPTGILVGGSFE